MACLFTHRRKQDPKTRLFMEFMIAQIGNVQDAWAARRCQVKMEHS